MLTTDTDERKELEVLWGLSDALIKSLEELREVAGRRLGLAERIESVGAAS